MGTTTTASRSPQRTYLDGLDAGEIRYQRCDRCGLAQRLFRYACTACGSDALSWSVSAGIGEVYAVTEVARAPSKALQSLAPYTLVLVDLAEGARLMGHGWPGAAIGDTAIGRVDTSGERALIRFEGRR